MRFSWCATYIIPKTAGHKASLLPLPGKNQAPQSMPSSVCPEWQPHRPPAGQRSSGMMWACGQQPAGGRGLARYEHRSGLYPVPVCQHVNPSENPRRNSTLGRGKRREVRGKEEKVNEEGKGKESGGRKDTIKLQTESDCIKSERCQKNVL